MTVALPESRIATHLSARPDAIGLSWLERTVLLVGIVEIPLGIDKAFAYHESDAMLGAVGGLVISITTITLAILYALWIGDIALGRRRMLYRPLLGIPMLIYLAIVLISSFAATKPILSMFDFGLLIQAYLLFFYIANRVQTQADLLFCLIAIAATVLAESAAIFFATAIGLNDAEIEFGPLLLTALDGSRQGGTLHSPVLAGSTMALMWLPVAASLLFIRDKWAWRFALLATTCGLLAILLTQTRGAILTSVVGTLIIAGGMLSRGWLPKWALPLGIVLGVLSIYPLWIVYEKRIQFGDEGSAMGRKPLALIAMETISERPLIGHGSGNCHLAAMQVAEQSDFRGEWYYTIHCKYLLVWIETGFFGFLAFLALLGNGLRHGISAWRTRDGARSALGLALVAALSGHMLHLFVDVFNSRPQVQMLWCVLGLAAAVYKQSHPAMFRIDPGFTHRLVRHSATALKPRIGNSASYGQHPRHSEPERGLV